MVEEIFRSFIILVFQKTNLYLYDLYDWMNCWNVANYFLVINYDGRVVFNFSFLSNAFYFQLPKAMELQDWGAVYTQQVFISNKTLLLWFSLPFTQQQRAGAPETNNIWNRVLECNLLKTQASFRWCKLTKRKPVKVVATLKLMLVQVNAIHSSHYQTPIKRSTVHPKQVEYDNSLLRWI